MEKFNIFIIPRKCILHFFLIFLKHFIKKLCFLLYDGCQVEKEEKKTL